MRKVILALIVTFVAAQWCPAQDEATLPAAKAGHVGRFFRYIGHHLKHTFTDVRYDREWAAVFLLDSAAQVADTWTTCRGLSRGFQESNPLFGHTRSCGMIVLGTSLVHLTKWTATHALKDEMVQQCWHDATQGRHRDWWEKGAASPSSCRHAMFVGVATTPSHIMNAYANECHLGGGCYAKPKPPAPKR
jgi:hypothetical protein